MECYYLNKGKTFSITIKSRKQKCIHVPVELLVTLTLPLCLPILNGTTPSPLSLSRMLPSQTGLFCMKETSCPVQTRCPDIPTIMREDERNEPNFY